MRWTQNTFIPLTHFALIASQSPFVRIISPNVDALCHHRRRCFRVMQRPLPASHLATGARIGLFSHQKLWGDAADQRTTGLAQVANGGNGAP